MLSNPWPVTLTLGLACACSGAQPPRARAAVDPSRTPAALLPPAAAGAHAARDFPYDLQTTARAALATARDFASVGGDAVVELHLPLLERLRACGYENREGVGTVARCYQLRLSSTGAASTQVASTSRWSTKSLPTAPSCAASPVP